MKQNLIVILAFLGGTALRAQTTVSTDPVGFVSLTIPAKSDAVVAVPLIRTSEYQGVIQSIVGNVITIVGSPAWPAARFNPGTKTYALQFATGTKEGMIVQVSTNGANTLTVTLDAGDSLAGVATEAANGAGLGDHINIMPYWTPASLFAANPPVGTEIFGFQAAGAGTNLGASEIYGFGGAGWEDEIFGGDASSSILKFGSAFVVRNNSAAAMQVTMVGSVPMTASRIRLSTLANNTDQDVEIGYMSPVPEAVISLLFPAVVGDSILGFDNSASGFNKGAATIYAFDGTQWVDDILGTPLDASVKLQPGFGYVFRKFRTVTPASVIWVHVQSYLH